MIPDCEPSSSVLFRFSQGTPWLKGGDADEKDQGKPDRKNIQAKQGDAKYEKSYIEQG